jgi:hypothetical protein
MRRREFIQFLGGAAAWPLAVAAQQLPKTLRIGAVSINPRTAKFWVAFEQRMTELGDLTGYNFALEFMSLATVDQSRPAAGSSARSTQARSRSGALCS